MWARSRCAPMLQIAHHGAEFGNSFFMPWGASVIEVRRVPFCCS